MTATTVNESSPQDHQATPSGRAILIVGFLSTVLIIASIIGLQAIFYRYVAAVSKRPSRDVTSANLIAEQEARLQQSGWINREDEKIAIPIDRAMELVVDELKQAQQRKAP